MRRLGTLLIVIIIVLAGVFSYALISFYNQDAEGESSSPAWDLARQMILPATPAIMPDPAIIVREVTQLARLETASFAGEKVVIIEKDSQGWLGLFSETIIFIAYGEVIAGIDFEKMKAEDIQVVDPTTVMVHLPPAEILVSKLDNERSSVVDRDQGLLVGFSGADPQLETQVRQAGEQLIIDAAVEYGILTDAEENAKEYMENLLTQLGFETIIFTEETPPVPPPYSQEIPKGYIVATPSP